MSGGGAEREKETQNLKLAPGSELSAQSRMQGWNSRVHDIMTWAEVGRLTDWATQAPLKYFPNYMTLCVI